MRAPESFTTPRMIVRRPTPADAPAVFARYASDPEVTRWLGFPRHQTVADAEAFVRMSDEAWSSAPAGPYLLVARDDGRLLGGTGLVIEAPWRAATGYVLARDAWGQGFATEATRAMIEVADALEIWRLYALCHVAHRASARVLEKCGFTCEGVLRKYMQFPNVEHDAAGAPSDVECWARVR